METGEPLAGHFGGAYAVVQRSSLSGGIFATLVGVLYAYCRLHSVCCTVYNTVSYQSQVTSLMSISRGENFAWKKRVQEPCSALKTESGPLATWKFGALNHSAIEQKIDTETSQKSTGHRFGKFLLGMECWPMLSYLNRSRTFELFMAVDGIY